MSIDLQRPTFKNNVLRIWEYNDYKRTDSLKLTSYIDIIVPLCFLRRGKRRAAISATLPTNMFIEQAECFVDCGTHFEGRISL